MFNTIIQIIPAANLVLTSKHLFAVDPSVAWRFPVGTRLTAEQLWHFTCDNDPNPCIVSFTIFSNLRPCLQEMHAFKLLIKTSNSIIRRPRRQGKVSGVACSRRNAFIRAARSAASRERNLPLFPRISNELYPLILPEVKDDLNDVNNVNEWFWRVYLTERW